MKIRAKAAFKKIRAIKGYSLNALARKMKVSPSVILKLERDGNVSPATAKRAYEALGESFETLFYMEEI